MNNETRRLRRELKGWQIYSITIGGIIGIGFFTNTGEVLSVAGPGGTVMAFFVVGLIAFFVMEGICEMIVLWPIPNAMVEFVRTFVDEDLAAVIGIGYCYTYTVTFSALILSASNLANYWAISNGLKSTIFAVAPIGLVILNLLWVEVFGWIEAIGGFLKLALVVFVFVLMILVNQGDVGNDHIGTKYWDSFLRTNTAVANSKAEAILIAIPKVTFAYIGIELLTTTAYEARDARQLKTTAMFIAPQVCILYVVIAAVFVSNVAWDDPRLPQIFGQFAGRDTSTTGTGPSTTEHPSSALPIIALMEAGSSTLPSLLTGVLMYSGLSAANTALYVASRTLYGFARNIEITEQSKWYRKGMHGISAVLPWTGAPLWGVILPAALLCWLPFIHLKEDNTKQLLQEVLLNIGSVSAVLVWFSQCVAYIFFWKRRQNHRARIEESNNPEIRRLVHNSDKNSLFAAGQPVWACLGAIGTFLIVFVFNSAVLWNGQLMKVKFFAAFLSPVLMILTFLIIKIKRTRFFTNQNVRHWGVDLSEYSNFEIAVQRLNGMINASPPQPSTIRKKRSFLNLIKFRNSEGTLRTTPNSTGSETRAPRYRPGNFEPLDEETGTSEDGNENRNYYVAHNVQPMPVLTPPTPRVNFEQENYAMQDLGNGPGAPRRPMVGGWEQL